jgi:hypothetical protein
MSDDKRSDNSRSDKPRSDNPKSARREDDDVRDSEQQPIDDGERRTLLNEIGA